MKKYRIEECTNGWLLYVLVMVNGNERVHGRFVFENIEDATKLILQDQRVQPDSLPPF